MANFPFGGAITSYKQSSFLYYAIHFLTDSTQPRTLNMNHFNTLSAPLLLIGVILLNQLTFADSIESKSTITQQEVQSTQVKLTVMLNVAKAIISATNKIKSCDASKRTFQLNEEDKNHLKKHTGALFFMTVASINLLNDRNCAHLEEMLLEKEFIKTSQALNALSLFPKLRDTLKAMSDTEWRKASENNQYNQLPKIPVDLLFYLKKRMGKELYDSSALFESLGKYHPMRPQHQE